MFTTSQLYIEYTQNKHTHIQTEQNKTLPYSGKANLNRANCDEFCCIATESGSYLALMNPSVHSVTEGTQIVLDQIPTGNIMSKSLSASRKIKSILHRYINKKCKY